MCNSAQITHEVRTLTSSSSAFAPRDPLPNKEQCQTLITFHHVFLWESSVFSLPIANGAYWKTKFCSSCHRMRPYCQMVVKDGVIFWSAIISALPFVYFVLYFPFPTYQLKKICPTSSPRYVAAEPHSHICNSKGNCAPQKETTQYCYCGQIVLEPAAYEEPICGMVSSLLELHAPSQGGRGGQYLGGRIEPTPPLVKGVCGDP